MPTETKTNDDNDCGLLLERHCCFWTTASVTSVWRKHVFVAIRQRQAEKNIRLYSKIHNILFANEQREAKRGHMHIICVMRFYYYYFLWLSINFGSMCAMCVGTEFMVMTWDRSDEKLCDRLRAAVRWHEYHFFFLLFIQWTWKKVFFYSIQKVVGWSLFNFFFVCLPQLSLICESGWSFFVVYLLPVSDGFALTSTYIHYTPKHECNPHAWMINQVGMLRCVSISLNRQEYFISPTFLFLFVPHGQIHQHNCTYIISSRSISLWIDEEEKRRTKPMKTNRKVLFVRCSKFQIFFE